jgi:hypothetical protein
MFQPKQQVEFSQSNPNSNDIRYHPTTEFFLFIHEYRDKLIFRIKLTFKSHFYFHKKSARTFSLQSCFNRQFFTEKVSFRKFFVKSGNNDLKKTLLNCSPLKFSPWFCSETQFQQLGREYLWLHHLKQFHFWPSFRLSI